MKSLMEKIKLWGMKQNPHLIRAALLFFPVFVITSIVIVGFTILVLQVSNFMPRQSTLSWETLAGSTVLFGSLIATTIVAAKIWTNWLGFPGLAFIGLNNDYQRFLTGILWGGGIQLLIFIVLLTAGWLQIVRSSLERQAIVNVWIITASSLNVAIVEEVVYRGVLYSSFRRKWSWVTSALITATLFALPHFISNRYDFPVIVAVGLLAGGILFAWTKEVTQTLWIPMGIHFGWDAAIGWFNLTASPSPHILVTSISAPTWVVGEWAISDLIALVAFALSVWLVSLRQKNGLTQRSKKPT